MIGDLAPHFVTLGFRSGQDDGAPPMAVPWFSTP